MLGTCGGGAYPPASEDESGASASATSSTSLQAGTAWRTFINLTLNLHSDFYQCENSLPQSCMRSSSAERRRSGGPSVRLMVRIRL